MEFSNNTHGFIKLIRSELIERLLKTRPTAFVLLTLIAFRARRSSGKYFDDLQIGEALLGDHESYRVTERIYRTDKRFLEKYGLITTKATSKGTIAHLVDASIFDINAEKVTDNETNKNRTEGAPTTTNKNEKNVNNEKKNSFPINNKNPILQDPDFRLLKEIYHNGDDRAVRVKMSVGPTLERRYPDWKYKTQWIEANRILRD